jgi:hypothetical protein
MRSFKIEANDLKQMQNFKVEKLKLMRKLKQTTLKRWKSSIP